MHKANLLVQYFITAVEFCLINVEKENAEYVLLIEELGMKMEIVFILVKLLFLLSNLRILFYV